MIRGFYWMWRAARRKRKEAAKRAENQRWHQTWTEFSSLNDD